MSTGLECVFVERSNDEWYYILEDWGAPVNAWDWMDYATAYGPFRNKKEGLEDLSRCHANPGGHSVIPLDHYLNLPSGRKDKIEALVYHCENDDLQGFAIF